MLSGWLRKMSEATGRAADAIECGERKIRMSWMAALRALGIAFLVAVCLFGVVAIAGGMSSPAALGSVLALGVAMAVRTLIGRP